MVLINMQFLKITNPDENHNGFQYINGLNILDKPFEKVLVLREVFTLLI
jgi:hypothetical protein